jgi:hypothetical protein
MLTASTVSAAEALLDTALPLGWTSLHLAASDGNADRLA